MNHRARMSFVSDPGVHFICGLSDVSAVISEAAELMCKLSSEDCEGVWFRDGQKVSHLCQVHGGATQEAADLTFLDYIKAGA